MKYKGKEYYRKVVFNYGCVGCDIREICSPKRVTKCERKDRKKDNNGIYKEIV